jgi:type II secretory pathway pseudopilin PulG
MLGNTTQFIQRFTSQKAALAKGLLSKSKRSEQGLTLLECLVAIVVVTAVISAITPPIMLTVATRVQNRRADQAKQLAQGAVDRVRRLVERGNYTRQELDRLVPDVVGNVYTIPVERRPEQLIDINGDNRNDFWVQVFRDAGTPDPVDPTKPVAFKLGVRVYAFFNDPQPLEVQKASLGLTSATGSQKRRPLAVLYTDVAISDTRDSRNNYCRFLNGDTPCP